MKILLIIVNFLSIYAKANVCNDFVFNYFHCKNIASIVGYSCNDMRDDAALINKLSKHGMISALHKSLAKQKIQVLAKSNYYKLGLFVDTSCFLLEDIASLLLNAADHRMYDELHCWLILSKNLSDILSVIGNHKEDFGFSTDFVVAVSSNAKSYQLYNVYKKFKAALNVTLYDSWDGLNGFGLLPNRQNSIDRSNFNGAGLKVIFFQSSYKPKTMSLPEYYQNTNSVTKDARIKYGYNVVIHLSEMYNFTIECVETEKWKPGDVIGPLVRALANSTVDLTGSSTNMNAERASMMTFLHQGWPFRTCFIFRNPQPNKIKIGAVFQPFAKSVWYSMGLISLTSMIILSSALKWDYEENSIANCFTLVVGAICQQCTDIRVTRYSTRIVVFVVMVYGLIMYNYYSTSVVSARLDEPVYKINDSLVELGKLGLKMSSERMFYLSFFFAVPFWEVKVFHKYHWLKISESERFTEPEIGMQLVQKGGFAYHIHPDVGYAFIDKYYDNREICELMEVHLGYPTDTWFGVTKNSTFKEIFKIGFTKITQVGIRHRQIKRWQYRKPRCRKDILSATSINIYEIAPHLIILTVGVLLSIFIWIIEVMSSKWILPIEPLHKRD